MVTVIMTMKKKEEEKEKGCHELHEQQWQRQQREHEETMTWGSIRHSLFGKKNSNEQGRREMVDEKDSPGRKNRMRGI
jgi:hypothetical protein